MKRAKGLIPAHVAALRAYVPGEQPRIRGLIKLNTNENPYPPSAKVLAAVREAVDDRMRLYPDPSAAGLRAKLAKLHKCSPENIIVGNGSDELLALAVRTFVLGCANHSHFGKSRHRATVQYFYPSYSLYPVLADIHACLKNPVLLDSDFSIPSRKSLRQGREWLEDATLTFITTPNAPSGKSYPTDLLETICSQQNGIVVLDEAYVDFARQNALSLALKHPNVLAARTFSKAYSLCFQRVGYMVGSVELIEALHKTRDSYNVNGLGQIAAAATLDDLPYYRANFKKIVATRQRTTDELTSLGFFVFPSETNFLLVRPPVFEASQWLDKLRKRKLLVRWFDHPSVRDLLRITIGTDEQMDELISAAKAIVR